MHSPFLFSSAIPPYFTVILRLPPAKSKLFRPIKFDKKRRLLLFTHVCPATGFCRCCAFQIGKICCQNCIVRNFQFRIFLPVNSYDRSSLPVPLPSSDGRHYMWFPASKSTSFLHFCDKSHSHLTFPYYLCEYFINFFAFSSQFL